MATFWERKRTNTGLWSTLTKFKTLPILMNPRGSRQYSHINKRNVEKTEKGEKILKSVFFTRFFYGTAKRFVMQTHQQVYAVDINRNRLRPRFQKNY